MSAIAPTSTPVLTPESQAVLARLHHPVWVFDIDHARVLWANPGALAVWNAPTLAELQQRDLAHDMSDSVARRLVQFQHDFLRHDAQFSEIWTLYPQGMPRTLRVMFSGMRLPDGRMAMLCEGLGEQQGDPETLRSAEALLHTSVMITLYSRQGQPLYRNPAARDVVADPTELMTGHFCQLEDAGDLLAQLRHEGHGRVLARVHTHQGERWHEISARCCHDAVTGGDAVLFSEVDISDLKRTEARAHYLAHHDTLTGLPNRHFVSQSFARRLTEVATQHHEAALIFIDLDHFKDVNDSLGHAAGDALLVQVAQRLRAELREGDMVARLGGDEFLVLVSAPQMDATAQALAQRLLEALSQPVVVDGHELRTTPSMGLCLFPRDGSDMDSLMRHADMAMYRAKERGRHRIERFSADLNTSTRSRIALEADLRLALRRGEFEVYYQPRLEVDSGQVVAAEALVRWNHPERGLVEPVDFIPACEDNGLIGALGILVMEQAIRQQLAWQAQGLALKMSINLSPRQLTDPGLLSSVQALISATGCQPATIELEITESVLLGHDDATSRTLDALRSLGFGIAIDDFGMGYSNLAYLRQYPINSLKIDRSFVHELNEAKPITGLIIAMSRLLGLRVVAEGVETAAQLDWLKNHGCDEFQGYLVSPPVPATAFATLLRQARA